LSFLLFASGLYAQETAKPLVAVFPFSSKVLDSGAIDGLVSSMCSELIHTGKVRVMERSEMRTILGEQGFQESGSCDGSQCAVQAGKLLSVDFLILGDVGKVGETYSVSSRIVNVRTGEVLRSATRSTAAKVDVILTDILPKLAREMAGQFTTAPADTEADSSDEDDDTDTATAVAPPHPGVSKPLARSTKAAESDDSDEDEDAPPDGWQKWNASAGVSAQQPHLKGSSTDTTIRGLLFSVGRDWTSGHWTVSPALGLEGARVHMPSEDSNHVDLNPSLGVGWSPLDWLSTSLTGFYTLQTGHDDYGASGSVRGTFDANDHVSFLLGLASTWSHLGHGSGFVEPGVNLTSTWLDFSAEVDLGAQWEDYSRLVDSNRTVIRKGVAKDTVVQTIRSDSGEVPMLQSDLRLSLHGKVGSIGPYWKFQAWQKVTTDTTIRGKTSRLTQNEYTSDLGLAALLHATPWLDLDFDASRGTQTGTTNLNGHTLTQRSNPRLAKNYPWLKTASLPTGWNLSLTAETRW
jgi:hypothetical protein